MDDNLEVLADRLAAIEEELRDRAYEQLTEQARDPDSDEGAAAKEMERRVNQARRAVAKAEAALRGRADD